MKLSIVSGPNADLINQNVTFSDIYANYTRNGQISSYAIDMACDMLSIHRTLKSKEINVLEAKINQALTSIGVKLEKHIENEKRAKRADDVQRLNNELADLRDELESLLSYTLDVDDAIDWETLKDKSHYKRTVKDFFDVSALPRYVKLSDANKPIDFIRLPLPEQPEDKETYTRKNYALFQRWFYKEKIDKKYQTLIDEFERQTKKVESTNQERQEGFKEYKTKYAQALIELEKDKLQFLEYQRDNNEQVDRLKKAYLNHEKAGIEEYCLLVLENSEYPDCIPRNFDVEFQTSGVLIVNFSLPSSEDLPQIESYKYIKSRNEVTEKAVSAVAMKKRFESVNYQLCIRTIHELFEADTIDNIDTIVFNGIVSHNNPATGINETKVIMSVSATKAEFMAFDLSNIDPKATFKHLKGVAATGLIDTVAIPPIAQFEATDKRFVESRDVNSSVTESTNLAAMHWEEFEHLVRQLFEQEFTSTGGEVKVTQASSDGGVDAIAFDPDPIRGGKIVIQAKRYTNTVGVAAVRELYGTVLNEGATKGILVTTSDFGGDSLTFVKDKPITLINGSNLLSLLEKHGVKAAINIALAKQLK